MMFRALLMACAMLTSSITAAQTAPPIQTAPPAQSVSKNHWNAVPATSGSSNDQAETALPGGDSHGPFHFDQPDKSGPAYALPPQANDKATVMGKQRPWQNGRPPLDCKGKPDPACH
ncbi:MAG: hypothetical protein ABI268_02285 [Rhodanobacter sp.]